MSHRSDRATEGCGRRDCELTHCGVCGYRHLRQDEPRTCLPCLGQARGNLAEILHLAALGADRLDGWPTSTALDRPAPGGGELGMPGGDLLALLGPGSDGHAEDAGTWRGDDPPSVAWMLCAWEDDWRRRLRLRAATATPERALSAAARFLDEHLGWAAQQHDAFADLAHELADARTRLEAALRAGNRPLRAPVTCFGCGGVLVRDYADPKPCRHPGVPGAPCGCDQGGLVPNWRCRTCARTYTEPEYWLAVRARLDAEQQAGS